MTDGIVATSGAQRDALWRLRHSMSEAQKIEGASIKHDISVPVSRVGEFVARASAWAESAVPGVRVVAFGHLGDGNVHFNLSQPVGADPAAFLARWDEIAAQIHQIAVDFGGSFSAEHGIGSLKVGELERWRGGVHAGADACDQGRARSAQHHESGQAAAVPVMRIAGCTGNQAGC